MVISIHSELASLGVFPQTYGVPRQTIGSCIGLCLLSQVQGNPETVLDTIALELLFVRQGEGVMHLNPQSRHNQLLTSSVLCILQTSNDLSNLGGLGCCARSRAGPRFGSRAGSAATQVTMSRIHPVIRSMLAGRGMLSAVYTFICNEPNDKFLTSERCTGHLMPVCPAEWKIAAFIHSKAVCKLCHCCRQTSYCPCASVSGFIASHPRKQVQYVQYCNDRILQQLACLLSEHESCKETVDRPSSLCLV